jgi:hypothetical protein
MILPIARIADANFAPLPTSDAVPPKTFRADLLALVDCATPYAVLGGVDCLRHNAKVLWIAAQLIAADVVNYQAVWYGTVAGCHDKPMDQPCFALILNATIATNMSGSLPY